MKAVAVEGVWSSDGTRLAYRPYIMAYSGPSGWRQHRGGDTPPIWILDPAAKHSKRFPTSMPPTPIRYGLATTLRLFPTATTAPQPVPL